MKLTCIIVGAGHRAHGYASLALSDPEQMEVVGVADPSELRRKQTAERFGLRDDQCWESAEALAKENRKADFIINGTMDHQHLETSLPLFEKGYDMLLEKPFAVTEEEMWTLAEAAKKHNVKVAICHVLRHAPFYAEIRKRVEEGAVGEIINIQATEHVSYHHMSVGYIRGKWNKKSYCGSTMLMAKSCHDLDLIAWMKGSILPRTVSSFGSNFQFVPEKAPEGAGTRCLVDCPVEKDCLYSAKKHFIDHPKRWAFYVWDSLEYIDEPTIEDKIESLKTSPYGQCAWKTDMDVVDHQSVVIEFEDGSTATLNMIGGCSKPSRSIHLIGTTGEIQGNLEESLFVIRNIDPGPGNEFSEETVDLKIKGDMTGAHGGHGGGDQAMVVDFLKYLRGEGHSLSTTSIEDSVNGHLVGFCANVSAEEHRTVAVDTDRLRGIKRKT